MTTRTYRIAHYGTGDTGSQALRDVIARPEFELVAHLAHTPTKAGRDSGEIVGVGPVGVRATTSLDEFLSVDADCVTYFATDMGRDRATVVEELCTILRSGRNVVTSTMPALTFPPALPADVREPLETACREGGTSLFCSGIAPGFTTDSFVLAAARLCDRVESIRISERIFTGTYADPLSYEFLGFGKTPEEDAAAQRPPIQSDAFAAPFGMLGAGLGITFDEVRAHRAVAVTDVDATCAVGPIPAGTIASVRLGFDGIVDGEPRASITIIYSMIDRVVDDWAPTVPEGEPFQSRLTQLVIDGSPTVDLRLQLGGSDQPGVDATAALVVNAIPATCAASPGLHSPFDLPLSPVRSFAPSAR